MSTARPIVLGVTPATFTDWAGNGDTNDYYQFMLNTACTINILITGWSADADLELLSSTGSVIQGSRNWGTQDERITRNLGAGTYFIRAYPYGNANTYYNLTLWVTDVVSPPLTEFDTTYAFTAPCRTIGMVVIAVHQWLRPTLPVSWH